MKMKTLFRSTGSRIALGARLAFGLTLASSLGAAWADDATDPKSKAADKSLIATDVVVITGQSERAATLAPTQSTLEATEPQSVISQDFIENSKPKTSDFMSLLQITPSAGGLTSGNGPGLGEAKTTLRGFKDGEFNVTFDAIPFGDTNNPTHHSTSFFPAADLGQIVVERGPGNADNLGQASFGGTVNLNSKHLLDDKQITQSATYGTWNTYDFVTSFQTGAMLGDNQAHAMLILHEINSDGALSNSPIDGKDQMLKGDIQFLGGRLHLTGLVTHDWNTYYSPDATSGLTQARVNQVGKDYQFGTDPSLPDYFGYYQTRKQTWFSYVRAELDVTDNVKVEDEPYYYYYDNKTLSALDTTIGTNGVPTTANLVRFNPSPLTGAASTTSFGIPGYDKFNHYSVYGNIAKARADVGFGTLIAGLWSEYASTERHQFARDMITTRPNYSNTAAAQRAIPQNINYLQSSSWRQNQPFAQFEWRPIEGLKITPGVKYIQFTRSVDAPVNQTSRAATNFTNTWKTTLPFLTVNYLIRDNWSVYGQYAKGFLAPDLNTTYLADPTKSSFEPQKSVNYQAGTVYKTNNLTLDADVYEVDFTNKVVSVAAGQVINGVTYTDPQFINFGGATYKGVEAQGTYAFDFGLAVFLNGSKNDSTDNATNKQLPNAPLWTAAGGLIYAMGPVQASLVHKIVGKQFTSAGETNKLLPLETTSLNASYDFGKFELYAGVENLFDNQDITSIAGSSPNFRYAFSSGRFMQVGAKVTF